MIRRLAPALATLGLAVVFLLGPAPRSLVSFEPALQQAEARPGGHGGGFRGHAGARPGGARVKRPAFGRPAARPAARPGRPATRPAARPGRPATRPAIRPGRPATRPVDRPGARPPGARPPGARPPGARPPGGRPPGYRPPGARPPGYRPPGYRPPGYRPPLAGRPPGWRPPHWRPPAWRPPAYRPPYARPPHYRWGSYYWYPRWGWYFTAAVAGATLVYVATLPEDDECQRVQSDGETLYLCDGVLYRSTLYENQKVYEIVSEPEEVVDPETGARDVPSQAQGGVLQLTSPRMRGPDVLALQRELAARGYDLGTPDGVFGPATDRALRAFQESVGLAPSGVVNARTAEALGL